MKHDQQMLFEKGKVDLGAYKAFFFRSDASILVRDLTTTCFYHCFSLARRKCASHLTLERSRQENIQKDLTKLVIGRMCSK